MQIKPNQLSKMVGVSRQAISDLIKKGKLIRNEQGLIDFQDEINKNYLISKGVNLDTGEVVLPKAQKTKAQDDKPEPNSVRKPKLKKESKETPIGVETDDFQALTGLPDYMLNITIRELVMKYGGPHRLKSFVEILDKIMSAQKKDVDVQERRRVLIPKEFAVSYLFQYLDICNNQIFDYPDSVIEQIIAEVMADEKKARLKIPEKIRQDTTKIFKEAKKNIQRALRQLQEKYDDSPNA